MNHTLALSQDGETVWSFGDGEYGKLGIGNTAMKMEPARIDALDNTVVVKVCAAAKFSVILSKCGKVYTFGQGTKTFKLKFKLQSSTPCILRVNDHCQTVFYPFIFSFGYHFSAGVP